MVSSPPSAMFTAESNHDYCFRSVAVDRAGNVEQKPVSSEALTYVPDLSPPDTAVTSVDDSSSTFTVGF